MALDATYFWGDLYLANQQASRSAISAAPAVGAAALLEMGTQIEGENILEGYIAEHEPRFLKKLLGIPLYEAYTAGMQSASPSDIWAQLDSQIYRVIGVFKLSPAANYVYCEVRKGSGSETTTQGEMKVVGKGGTVAVSPIPKFVTAWNKMTEMVIEIRLWVASHSAEITEAIGSGSWSHAFHHADPHICRMDNDYGL